MSERASLGFGNYFTPHMTVTRWMPASGWLPVEVADHATLPLAPSALALHYGQAVFESGPPVARAFSGHTDARPALTGTRHDYRCRLCLKRCLQGRARHCSGPI